MPVRTQLTPQTPARLTQKENLILAAFSVLYTINIAVSNISLQLVTVPVRFRDRARDACAFADFGSSIKLCELRHHCSLSSSLPFC